MKQELRLHLADDEVTNDLVVMTLTESEVQALWNWIKREYMPHDTDLIILINKIAKVATKKEKI